MKRLALLLLLAACSAPQAKRPAADTCGAAPYEALIGQPATALERELILRQIRVIRPGDLVTTDFVPERINFQINSDGQIDRITCG